MKNQFTVYFNVIIKELKIGHLERGPKTGSLASS